MFGVRLFFLALLFSLCLGHATITKPAMRSNPSAGEYCPWCQGSQVECSGTTFCKPPSPCWGAKGPTVGNRFFSGYSSLKDDNGDYWVEQTDGNDTRPVWCPGESIPYAIYINADHNGIYRFQMASSETESAFKDITSWKSINMDDEPYYDSDGITQLKPGVCKGGAAWSPAVEHCRDNTLYKSTFTVPTNQPAGNTIFRWIWYGAMTIDGQPVTGPEKSLFVNCKDVIIGSAQQCRSVV